jgi:hypothetical protein
MNEMSLKQKRKLTRDIAFYRGESLMDDDQERELINMEEEHNIIPKMIRRAEDIVDVIPAEYELEDVVQPNYEENEPGEQEYQEIPTAIPPEITVSNESNRVQPTTNVDRDKR